MSYKHYTAYLKKGKSFEKLLAEIDVALNDIFYSINKPVLFSVHYDKLYWQNKENKLIITSYSHKKRTSLNIYIPFKNKTRCKAKITAGISENSVGYIEGIHLHRNDVKFKIRIGNKLKTYTHNGFVLVTAGTPCSNIRTTVEDRRKISQKIKADKIEVKRLKLEALKIKVIKNYLGHEISLDAAILINCPKTKKIEYGVVTEMLDKGFKFITPKSNTYTCNNVNFAFVPDNEVMIDEIQNAVTVGILTNA